MSDETKYLTRYRLTTASDHAIDLVDRARFRIEFLGAVFNLHKASGESISLSGYTACGLGYILQDISDDLASAFDYFYGDDPTPGKISIGK